jgi:predicted RecB family nuclease
VVWDIETDLAQSRIWLIGAHDTLTGETRQFFDPDDEEACIGDFLEWMVERPTAIPISYSGSRFDARVLRKSTKKHGLTDVTGVADRDIDIGIRLLYNCVSTLPSTKVKELAGHLGYKFQHPGLDGMSVGLMYSQYIETGRKPKSWKPYIEYNADDVGATALILKWLQRMCNLTQDDSR